MRDNYQSPQERVVVRATNLQDRVNRLYKELDSYEKGVRPRDDERENRIRGMIIAYEQLLLWDKYEGEDIPSLSETEED